MGGRDVRIARNLTGLLAWDMDETEDPASARWMRWKRS